jgi:hypothetical protein
VGLQALAPLVALQWLDLENCKQITDAGLQALAPLVALQSLNVYNCTKISTEGLLQALPTGCNFKSGRNRSWLV